jgi:hypothetical protein
MSASALFTPVAGDFFVPVSVRLATLPRCDQLCTWRVYCAILDYLPRGCTELGERFTDRVLRQSPWLEGYSSRFVQRGLQILDRIGIIRRERAHGRRRIIIVGRLRGSTKPEPQPRAGAKPTRSSSVPNVGTIVGATPEQVAIARARIAATDDELPAASDEDLAEVAKFLEESKRRREAKAQQSARPAPLPRVAGAAGTAAQVLLESRRQSMGIRIVPDQPAGP